MQRFDQYSMTGFAPHAGAWIETYNVVHNGFNTWFAPHAGAWIETKNGYTVGNTVIVRPSCGGVD